MSEEDEEQMLKLTGYDDCIVGVVELFGEPDRICYDREKVINKMMDDEMTYDDAVEFFEFNIAGAYVGPTTPCFLVPYEEEEEE